MRTRYVLENGWWSCTLCHKKFDNNKQFRMKVTKVLLGEETYMNLRSIADGKRTVTDYGYTEVN